MPKWSKGRIALVGDAGYCPSPLSGQGTSLALVGSYMLAGELAASGGEYKKAFSRYEAVIKRFVKKNQNLAKLSASVIAGTEDSFIARLHHYLSGKMPDSWLQFVQKWGLRRIEKAANSICIKKLYP